MDTLARRRPAWCAPRAGPTGRKGRRAGAKGTRPRLRTASVSLMALAALSVPNAASALVPLPDPPAVRLPLTSVGAGVLLAARESTQASVSQKRRLHNEMLLVVNTALATT
jgi:hypothetical protein